MESLARGGPWQMGTVLHNKSKWRALSYEETELYGGSSLRRLYGCVFTLHQALARPGGSSDLQSAEYILGNLPHHTWRKYRVLPLGSDTGNLQTVHPFSLLLQNQFNVDS